MIDSLLKTIEEASNKIKEEQRKLADNVKNNLNVAFKEIFNADPKLESFSWTQYTPYFNDGDQCYFNVNDYIDVVYDGQEYNSIGRWETSKVIAGEESYSKITPEAGKAVYPVLEMLSKIDNDIFQTIFGDHIRVTVTPNGITTEDYDHD